MMIIVAFFSLKRHIYWYLFTCICIRFLNEVNYSSFLGEIVVLAQVKRRGPFLETRPIITIIDFLLSLSGRHFTHFIYIISKFH